MSHIQFVQGFLLMTGAFTAKIDTICWTSLDSGSVANG